MERKELDIKKSQQNNIEIELNLIRKLNKW